MIEMAVLVLDSGDGRFDHCIWNGNSNTGIGDHYRLWDLIWTLRYELVGIGHSHPGSGPPSPSRTDITTFRAIELGLGRTLDWWITTQDQFVAIRRASLDHPVFEMKRLDLTGALIPNWLRVLRKRSNY